MESYRTAKDELHSLLSTRNNNSNHHAGSPATVLSTETIFSPGTKINNEKSKSKTVQMTPDTDSNHSDHPSCCRQFLDTEIDDVTSLTFWKACVAEFWGTFLLCFFSIAIGLSHSGSTPPSLFQIAVGTGFFIAALVSSLAAASGCHINPAVTLGFASLRHISLIRAFVYIVFQCAGAVTGSIVLREVIHPEFIGNLGVILPTEDITDQQAIAMEAMLTSFLMFVVIGILDKGRTDVQGSVPLIVGLTVASNILVGGQSSGACMNPARAIGPAVVMGDYRRQWVYWVGPVCGGVAGSLLYDKVFAVGASFRSVCRCCSVHSTEYESVVKKESAKLEIELETTMDSNL